MQERLENQKDLLSDKISMHMPEYKEDFGSVRSEEIGQQIFKDFLGGKNVEDATDIEDKIGEVKKGTKQPKVDFWIRIPVEGEKPIVVGVQWTFTTSPEKALEKRRNLDYNNGLVYKQERSDSLIKTDEPATATLIEVDKNEMKKLDQIYNIWSLENSDTKGKFADRTERKTLHSIIIQLLNQLKPTEKRILLEKFAQ